MTYDAANEHGDRECTGCGEPEAFGHLETCPRAGPAFYVQEVLAAFVAAYALGAHPRDAANIIHANPWVHPTGWNAEPTRTYAYRVLFERSNYPGRRLTPYRASKLSITFFQGPGEDLRVHRRPLREDW